MGLNAFKPAFRLLVEGQDITAVVQESLISLTLTDKAGGESDQLIVRLADTGFALPERGRVMSLALGFGDDLVSKGRFVVDDIAVSGPVGELQITGSAAPMDAQLHKGKLQTQKSRSWDDISLGDLVGFIAEEHGLVGKVSPALAGRVVKHVDQVDESDMNLLTRLASQHGAVSKPVAGYWLFAELGSSEGQAESVSGQGLPDVAIVPEQVTTWSARFNSRNSVQKVVASWRDDATGESHEVEMGAGEPAFRIAFVYPTKEEAEAAAKAKAKSVKSGSNTLELTLPAVPELMNIGAESRLVLQGFRDGLNRRWRAESVVYGLSSSGLSVRVSAEAG